MMTAPIVKAKLVRLTRSTAVVFACVCAPQATNAQVLSMAATSLAQTCEDVCDLSGQVDEDVNAPKETPATCSATCGPTAGKRRTSLDPTASKLKVCKSDGTGYSVRMFRCHLSVVPVESLSVLGGMVIVGAVDWKWFHEGFHFTDEGWFGNRTRALGMDKLGHALGTASIADGLAIGLRQKNQVQRSAAITGAIYGFGIMTLVEVADGTSDYGFSPQDLAADALGATWSYLRNAYPRLRETIDLRVQFQPSHNDAFRPWSDYSGQTYLLAVKMSGFK